MTLPDPQLLDRLAVALQDLPEDRIREVIDFAGYLRAQQRPPAAQTGTAEAFARALENFGPLQFEAGELDDLLAEIESMRARDLNDDANLSA
jgi:hypothetical protein